VWVEAAQRACDVPVREQQVLGDEPPGADMSARAGVDAADAPDLADHRVVRDLEPLPRLRNRRNGAFDDAQRRSREKVHERVKRLRLLGRERCLRILLERSGRGLRDRELLLQHGVIAGIADEASFDRGAAPRETEQRCCRVVAQHFVELLLRRQHRCEPLLLLHLSLLRDSLPVAYPSVCSC
jgi:hypothetical protein